MFHCSSSKLILFGSRVLITFWWNGFQTYRFPQIVYPNIMLMQFSPSKCSQNTCIIAKYITDFIMVHVLWYKTPNKQTKFVISIWIEVDFFLIFSVQDNDLQQRKLDKEVNWWSSVNVRMPSRVPILLLIKY